MRYALHQWRDLATALFRAYGAPIAGSVAQKTNLALRGNDK